MNRNLRQISSNEQLSTRVIGGKVNRFWDLVMAGKGLGFDWVRRCRGEVFWGLAKLVPGKSVLRVMYCNCTDGPCVESGTIKDTTDAEINSLLDLKIQQEILLIQSLSVLNVPVFVISEPSVLTPILETPLVTPTTTLLPLPSVTTIPPTPLQSTTPIPTPPITTKAPQITLIPKELVDQAWVKHSKDHFRAPTAHDMEILIKTCLMPLAIKTQNDSFAFVHELKQEMHADLKYVESLEKEIDELESDKAEFSNMYDILLQECVSNDVMCSYLHSLSDLDAHTELQCLYLHKVKECECLAQKLSKQTETVSKEVYTELLRSFAKLEKHSISLELALQQCQEQMKNDTVCKEKVSNVFQKECEQYFKIQDLKAQLQDKNIAICELKILIEKCKGKSVEPKFDKPFVVRQPNAQKIPKPSVLGKPTPFLDSRSQLPRHRFASQVSGSHDLTKPVTLHSWPQVRKSSFAKAYDVNAPPF
ncbi:hypothetical protein Tco_0497443 [Tanacetum coccineum]